MPRIDSTLETKPPAHSMNFSFDVGKISSMKKHVIIKPILKKSKYKTIPPVVPLKIAENSISNRSFEKIKSPVAALSSLTDDCICTVNFSCCPNDF